jgi:hypothetical protein
MALEILDIVGYRPTLTIFERDRYKSFIGKLVGLLAMLTITILCIYFIIKAYFKREFTIIYNQSTNMEHKVDLSDSPMLMIITDGLTNPVSEEFHELRVNFWNYTRKENEQFNTLKINEIELEPCKLNKHFGGYADMFKNINVELFKCIPFKQYDLTLYGKYGDAREHSFINFSVNMCNNKTTNNTCPDKSVLEPIMKNIYLNFLYIDYEVDHFNYTQPFKKVVRTETFPINWDLHSRYFYAFNTINYETDIGFIFEDIRTDRNYKFMKNEQNVQIRHGSSLYPEVTIGTVTLFNNPTTESYNRYYPKFETLLAKVSAVIHSILLIGRLICRVTSKNLFLNDLINLSFTYNPDAGLVRKEKSFNSIDSSINNITKINISNKCELNKGVERYYNLLIFKEN